ncbi:lysosome membrane protein 2-like isoform X1 [Macrobrachium rosenbergii]|uniref:lysosome membrane protein 2-like isoform X1 n=1 Tax=Macrobrachium rosenbergii TaxID=79674 RepID=UPI0034D72663
MLPMKQVTIMTVIGSILVLLCSIFLGVFPSIFNSIVNKMLVLSKDSATLGDFISPPVPIYMQFYLFHVTNPDDIRFHGAKPKLKQIGPYTYAEVRTKHNMTWNDDEGTVTYLQDKSYFFREDLSHGLKESDRITTINPIMVVLADFIDRYRTKNNSLLLDLIWTEIESGFDLFATEAIGDTIFYGFDLPEFDFDFSDLSILPGVNLSVTEGLNGSLYDILDLLNERGVIHVAPPESLKSNQIHFLKNNTDDHPYEVKTGAKGLDDYLRIVKWNGNKSLSYWNDNYCDMINGTDGTQFPPQVSKDQALYIYTSELCRSLYLTYEKEIDVHGVTTYRFIPPKDALEDPMVNPDNQCFCYPNISYCLHASMLNMAPCAFDAPIVLSTPHFYQGNQEDIDSIDGLAPHKDEHETYLDIEPNTGVAMRAMKKMQLNVPLKRYGSFPSFKNVPEVIFPIVWVNESAQIDEDTASSVRKALYTPFTIVDAICGTLIGIGALLILVGTWKFIGVRRARNQQKL